MSRTQIKPLDRDNDKFVGLILLALVPLAIGFAVAAVNWKSSTEWPEAGQKGDFFGGHIAAFGTLTTVILLVLTVWMQRSELKDQRRLTEATLREIEQTKHIHEAQKRQLERQAEIAEKVALRTHLFDLSNQRKPLLEAFLKALRLSTYEDLRILAKDGGSLLDSSVEIYGHEQNNHTAIFSISIPLRRADRYISKALKSDFFDESEQEYLSHILEVIPDSIIDNNNLFGRLDDF